MNINEKQIKESYMDSILLPTTTHTNVAGQVLGVAFFRLWSDMGNDYSRQLLEGIKTNTTTLESNLIVIDIFQGEPKWLAASLDVLRGYGAPIIIHPPRAASSAALEALKSAQADNSSVMAEKLGFLLE